MNIQSLQSEIRRFVEEREWEKYHTPKNLIMALAGEVGELTEIFQWLTAEESQNVMSDGNSAQKVRHEVADVFVYLLRLADKLNINLEEAVREKLILNQQKYPAHLAKGTAKKYTEF